MTGSESVQIARGINMPALGLGFAGPSEAQAFASTKTGIELGYRSFDTAAVYRNERGVGRAIREASVPRSELFVTTKLWIDDMAEDRARPALQLSLDRLMLDYVDLYLLHWPAPGLDRYVPAWRELMKFREEGLVRSIGVSNFEPQHLTRLIDETGEAPSVNQVEMHPYLSQATLREVHRQLGITTVAYSPLGIGNVLQDPVVNDLARKFQVTPAQVVLSWHRRLGVVPIPRSSSAANLRSNLESNRCHLDDGAMAALSDLDRGERLWWDPNEFSGSPELVVPRYAD